MKFPWPKTMFGRMITVLIAALVLTQVLFVWAVLEPLRSRPLPGPEAQPAAAAAAPEATRRRPRRPWLPLVNVLLASSGIAVGAFFVSRSLTRPLGRLAEAADALGADVRAPAVKEEGPLETRQVAQAFNVMRERLIRHLDSHSALLASMSHDMRTPLTRLRLRAEEIEDESARARFVADLDELTVLVDSTLRLMRGQVRAGEKGPVDVADLLHELRREWQEVGIEVSLSIQGQCTLTGHRLSLKRALNNLIENALKFGGQAEVEGRLEPELARIWVRDRGPGIPEDQLQRVFEPFYRVESSRSRDTGGSGLGLAIALDAIQAHRGSLQLRNREGGGLEAAVTLPFAA
jgi:signal transduction histidine kinase